MGMSAGDGQASRRVVKSLLRLPLVDRIKAVKDVVLNQLGDVKAATDALARERFGPPRERFGPPRERFGVARGYD